MQETTKQSRTLWSRPPQLNLAQRMLVFVYLGITTSYLLWRPSTFNPDAMGFSVLVYGAEIFGFLCAVLFLFMCWRLKERIPPPVPRGTTADVFVPSINESVSIVRRTLMAAKAMDHVGEVWLLDDGNRPEMRALANRLDCRYLARTDNTDAKAGNINNALQHCTADYIAFFDADHAPSKDFLTSTLGFFEDPLVAFVQTPHDFYNLDSFQNRIDADRSLVWSEQLLFFRVIQAGKDRLNSSFFCGSCAVLRRTALSDIGGVATGTVTEDIHTSLQLHKRGWKSVYYGKPLAFGLAPASASAFLKQRLRWGQGAMQTWRLEGVLTTTGLTMRQRLSYLATVLAYFEGWQRLILYFSPVVVLITGIMPIAELDVEFLVRFIPYFVLNYWVLAEISRGYGRLVLIEQYTMIRFAIFIVATFGYLLRKLRFVVTPKNLGEADATKRFLWPQMLVLSLNAIAIPIGVALQLRGSHLPDGALIANAIWAGLTVWVAALAIRHAFRVASHQRREYRFPIPVPLRLSSPHAALALVTDLSPSGCRVSCSALKDLGIGNVLEGRLLLPAAQVDVRAIGRTVTREPDSEETVVGCEFAWENDEERARLELFLYGSDIQWHFNGYTDRARTALEKLSQMFSDAPKVPDFASRLWTPLLYRHADRAERDRVAFLSPPRRGTGERSLVALDRFPDGAEVSARALTRDGESVIAGRLHPVELPDVDVPNMNIYRWTA